ncbi:MAG: ATP/GTP-binding protein [Thermomicrobium sp.]|nr:ATP/GTP-binding protein [Thermomicrobium sp.]
MQQETLLADLLERVRAGDRGALARAFSLLERAPELWRWESEGNAAGSFVVAVAGPPGAGKSTLLGAIARALSSRDMSCGIVAFDPASPRSGGALLGDRIRMLDAAALPNVFVRSVAARDPVGPGTAALPVLLALLELYGFDFVFLESVGAGQEATPLLALADSVLLVSAPGLGDSVQILKAGVLELADIVIVNKADRSGADELARELTAYFRLVAAPTEEPTTVLRTVATEERGIEDVLEALAARRERALRTRMLRTRRRSRLVRFLQARLRERCLRAIDDLVAELLHDDSDGVATPVTEGALLRMVVQRLASWLDDEAAR